MSIAVDIEIQVYRAEQTLAQLNNILEEARKQEEVPEDEQLYRLSDGEKVTWKQLVDGYKTSKPQPCPKSNDGSHHCGSVRSSAFGPHDIVILGDCHDCQQVVRAVWK